MAESQKKPLQVARRPEVMVHLKIPRGMAPDIFLTHASCFGKISSMFAMVQRRCAHFQLLLEPGHSLSYSQEASDVILLGLLA